MSKPRQMEPLRISVIGAGLAGLGAAILLGRIPNAKVTTYERSSVPREVGGFLGITPNAEQIVHEMVSAAEFEAIVHRGPIPIPRHWKTGEVLIPLRLGVVGNAACQRTSLHSLLLAKVDAAAVQGGRRALGLKFSEDSVACEFEGGESVISDLVVVADGLRSRLRESINLSAGVKYTGVVEYMRVVDISAVAHLENLPENPCFFSNGRMWVWMSPVDAGKFGMIISTLEPDETAAPLAWAQDGGPERLQHLRSLFSDWSPIITDFLGALDAVSLYPVYRGEWVEQLTYGGRVALIGDAAHPTGGAYSAGAGLAFCDAKALCLVLFHVQTLHPTTSLRSPPLLAEALSLYSLTRAPFLSRVFSIIERDARQREELSGVEGDEDRVNKWVEGAKEADIGWLRYHSVEEEFARVLAAAR